MKFTVLGASGFIGSHLVGHLRQGGHEVSTPARGEAPKRGAGHVVYAVGLTGDFRSKLRETVEAHVTVLSRALSEIEFDSFLYLSSTRVYGGLLPQEAGLEDALLRVRPSADSVYDLSKLLGEAICASVGSPPVRVARLSNVYGPGQQAATFLGAVVREFVQTGQVRIGEAPDSAKDYIHIDDVCWLLARIAAGGREQLYNVASGIRTCHADIAKTLMSTSAGTVEFAPGAQSRVFPEIDVFRIKNEFGYRPKSLLDELPGLVASLSRKQA